MKTLCNKAALVQSTFTFTSFDFYNKAKDAAGDICYYYANMRNAKDGYMQKVSVAVQNGTVIGWET